MKYLEIRNLARKMRNNPTKSEFFLWQRLKDRQLEGFKFIRQHPLLYDRVYNDYKFFIPDFYCPAANLIIELDGRIHDQTEEYDKWRDEIITHLNITVLRFHNQDLLNIEKVLDTIRIHLPILKGGCPKRVASFLFCAQAAQASSPQRNCVRGFLFSYPNPGSPGPAQGCFCGDWCLSFSSAIIHNKRVST